MFQKLKIWAKALKRKILVLYLAGGDPNVPRSAKFLALMTATYALSPIDLIPDFIPILGYLDDLIILPLMISLTIKLIPKEILRDLEIQAETKMTNLPKAMGGAFIIIGCWLAVITLIGWCLWPML